MVIRQNILLRDFTTFGIGGPAQYFTEVASEQELEEALNFSESKQLPFFVLGGGSNIVVSDEGFPGLVIANRIKGISISKDDNQVALMVGAGEIWDEIVTYSVEHNWAGIECLSGIPGSAGAAPIQNIGAYGQEVSSVIKIVHAFDTYVKKMTGLDNAACGFDYRKSIFNSVEHGRYIVTRITMGLKPGGTATLTYQDLKDKFPRPENSTLPEVRNAVIEIRARKGMVILPGYEGYRSAGSFFKHPVVSKEDFERIQELNEFKKNDPRPWFWLLPSEKVKLVATRLIETAGFPPGFRKDKIGISPKHLLALINHGGGTAGELILLAREIQEKVQKKFGITLTPEPEFVGFTTHPLS